jgi:hypothetical protein
VTNTWIYTGKLRPVLSTLDSQELTTSRVPVIRSTRDSAKTLGLKRIVERRIARRRVINKQLLLEGGDTGEEDRLIDHPTASAV